ncbi:hypothetical protein ASG72_15875 [Bosea sp. Leaf344]|uniref:DUF3572 domain-containing protein n=1 Tax=Bosea sp. Leaf344 TaxID=1736346 RepID=UPI0006F9790D|nr:DUF3572 domain-containing protein [Bosea sp. Leaf344]KQU51244.1 hypothetical protein ASG72_15875 [Bosea sp. Leaf344]
MRADRSIEDAEALALRALGFLASDPARLEVFLAETGLGPANLRAAAQEPGFLASVLDHIAGSDSLLLELAGNLSLNPETIVAARSRLAGPPPLESP